MKLPDFARLALVLAGCCTFSGLIGCRSTRYDSDYSSGSDRNDRTLFQYRGGSWVKGRGEPSSGTPQPQLPAASAYSGYGAPAVSPYTGDSGDGPVPYRNSSPGGGPHLRTPPHGISPDELPSDEGDDGGFGASRPTLKERITRLWRKRDVGEEQYDDDAPPEAAQVARHDSRPGAASVASAGSPQPAAAAREGKPAPRSDASARAPLVTQTSPTDTERPLDRPPRPLPLNSAATASPQVRKASRAAGAADRPMPNYAVAQAPGNQRQVLNQSGADTMQVVDPPVLHAPPSGVGLEPRNGGPRELSIPDIRICRQVRGFDDVVAFDPQKLRQGQPILIYAELEDFHSVSTTRGYRTLTLSTLEVRTSDGEVLARQPLGTAVDLADTPRREFFLTHQLTIPDDLPAGEYVFGLCVDDLLGHSSARAELAVRVTEGRSPPGGTADISVSARSPAGFRK